jgi:hypothetical protein
MTRDTNRRAVMGAVLAAGAFVAVPASATEVGVDPDLQALVAIFRGAKRRLEETSEAHGAASMRASDRCPVPESLIATDTDAGYWGYERSGYQYFDSEVASLRVWQPIVGVRPSTPVAEWMIGPEKSLPLGIAGTRTER